MTAPTLTLTIAKAPVPPGSTPFRATRLALPLRLIRGPGNEVLLEEGSGRTLHTGLTVPELSREHLVVSREETGEIALWDQSSNGVSLVSGGRTHPIGRGRAAFMRGEPGRSGTLSTVGLTITVAVEPPAPRLTDPRILWADLHGPQGQDSFRLGADALVILTSSAGLERLDPGPAPLDSLATAYPRGRGLALGAGPDGRFAMIALRGTTLVVNRRPVAPPVEGDTPLALAHRDLVAVDGFHLHILEEGAMPVLACINAACRMINDYTPNGNCAFCGTRLGDARTRLLRGPGGKR